MNKKIHITTFLSLILCLNISAMKNNKFNKKIEKKYKQANKLHNSMIRYQNLVSKRIALKNRVIEDEKIQAAIEAYKSIESFESGFNLNNNPRFRYILIQTYYNLAKLYEVLSQRYNDQKNIKLAIKYYQKTCSFNEKFIPAQQLSSTIRICANAKKRLSELKKNLENFKKTTFTENKRCNYCYKNYSNIGIKLKKCENCEKSHMPRGVFYCSKKCQKNDWTNHKKICGHEIEITLPIVMEANTKIVITTQKNIVELHKILPLGERYFNKKKYNLAIPILEKAIDLIKSLNVSLISDCKIFENLLERRAHIHFEIAECYRKTKQEKIGASHLKKIIKISNNIEKLNKQMTLMVLTTHRLLAKYYLELSKKEKKIGKYKKKTYAHLQNLGKLTTLYENKKFSKTIQSIKENIVRDYKLEKSLLKCNTCKKTGFIAKLQKCSQCKKTYYCSVNCQKQDWNKHKQDCKKSLKINYNKQIPLPLKKIKTYLKINS